MANSISGKDGKREMICSFCGRSQSQVDQLEQNVLNVLANVTGFGQGGGVRNRKRNVQHFGPSGTGKTLLAQTLAKHQYVGLLQLYVAFLPGKNALIMVVDRNRQHALGIPALTLWRMSTS